MSDKSSQSSIIPNPYFQDEESISIVDILLVIARQIKVVLIIPTIFCTITIIYVQYFAIPVYQSSAKITSSSGGSSASQAQGLAAQFGISLPFGQSEQKWVYPEIIKSRILARAMLERKFDTNEFGSNRTLLEILTGGLNQTISGLDTLEIYAINSLLDIIKVSEDFQTGIYTITLSASEPKFASDLTSALIEELDTHQRKYNKAKTSEGRQFVEERIIDTEKELQATEEALRAFRVRNRRIENSPSLQLEQQRLTREVAVLTGVFTTLKQQLELAKIEEIEQVSVVQVLDYPKIPLVRSNNNKVLALLSAGIIGIIIGIGLGLLRSFFSYADIDERKKFRKIN